MKDIKILGTGCAKCKQTETAMRNAVAALGIEATVEKVEDIQKIMEYDIMTTPAVVVDGEVRLKGRVPSAAEAMAILS